jgi:hypothetical protein
MPKDGPTDSAHGGFSHVSRMCDANSVRTGIEKGNIHRPKVGCGLRLMSSGNHRPRLSGTRMISPQKSSASDAALGFWVSLWGEGSRVLLRRNGQLSLLLGKEPCANLAREKARRVLQDAMNRTGLSHTHWMRFQPGTHPRRDVGTIPKRPMCLRNDAPMRMQPIPGAGSGQIQDKNAPTEAGARWTAKRDSTK